MTFSQEDLQDVDYRLAYVVRDIGDHPGAMGKTSDGHIGNLRVAPLASSASFWHIVLDGSCFVIVLRTNGKTTGAALQFIAEAAG